MIDVYRNHLVVLNLLLEMDVGRGDDERAIRSHRRLTSTSPGDTVGAVGQVEYGGSARVR